MSTVVIESLLTGQMEEIEVNLGKSSTFTFNTARKIGITLKDNYCNILIHPEGNNRPPIPIHVCLVPSVDGVDGTLGYSDFVEVSDPFSVPWEIYLQLSIEMVEKLTQRARDENEIWIKKRIEEHNAEWILIVNKEVIRWSRNRKDYPLEEELEKIAKRYNLFPFLFFRPPLIEESSWTSTIYENDYYPSIEISVYGNLNLTGDLDTGNPTTTLDRDLLISSNHLQMKPLKFPLQKAIFHNKLYEYSNDIIHIQITDESGKEKTKPIKCNCVKNWENSPFCKVNSKRQALVGRDILLEFPVEVRLNGKKQKTYIYL
ncbi:MAG: hypothetical protein QME42_08305 [bacterium]|nr:hypothetical protein [bacterium]